VPCTAEVPGSLSQKGESREFPVGGGWVYNLKLLTGYFGDGIWRESGLFAMDCVGGLGKCVLPAGRHPDSCSASRKDRHDPRPVIACEED